MHRLLSILLITLVLYSCQNTTTSYFDQTPPGTTPELFAPTLVNTDRIELNVVFNDDHTEMFFSRIVDSSFLIHHTEWIDGKWSEIEPLKLYADSVLVSVACDPTITKDGKTMYFLGVDPALYSNEVSREELYRIPPDIYQSKKINGEWQLATKVEYGVSTSHFETYPVVTADGTLYFRSNKPSMEGGMNTYRAKYIGNEKFDTPVLIDTKSEKKELIAYVSPDERLAITNGQGKFQISYKNQGEWSEPKEIPLAYESNWRYYCPYMTVDGKNFIFSRKYNHPDKRGWAGVEKGEVYWVSAEVLFNIQ